MKHWLLGSGGFALLSLIACGGNAPESGALDASLSTFARAKAQSASYSYDVPAGSWAGFSATTTVVVKGDRVVERSYASATVDGQTGKSSPSTSWDETGASIGSHAEGAPPRRIEDLYAQCTDEIVTKDRAKNDVVVSFNAHGLLETCVYAPKGCQDDCSHGVEMRNVSFAK